MKQMKMIQLIIIKKYLNNNLLFKKDFKKKKINKFVKYY